MSYATKMTCFLLTYSFLTFALHIMRLTFSFGFSLNWSLYGTYFELCRSSGNHATVLQYTFEKLFEPAVKLIAIVKLYFIFEIFYPSLYGIYTSHVSFNVGMPFIHRVSYELARFSFASNIGKKL